MTTQYEFKTEKFEGPLEKILELIEAQELEITEVSLARVTDDFIAHTRTLTEVAPALLADFVVVASRLILIKSKALIPEFSLSEEEERDVKELEDRLRLYRDLKATEEHVRSLWRSEVRSVGREYLAHLGAMAKVFYPAGNAGIPDLREAIGRVMAEVERFVLEEERVEGTLVSLEEKMQEVLERIMSVKETSFSTLASKRSRAEIIALFLAILHLAREEHLALEQGEMFSDIIVRKRALET